MDIYLTAIGKSGSFRFPSLPEEIKVASGANYQRYSIINIGEVRVPRGTECEKISWRGWFFGKPRRRMDYLGKWLNPASCVSHLKRWQKSGTPLRLLVTETGINLDVTIDQFDCTEAGGMGDIEYQISFHAYRELKMYTTTEMNVTTYEARTTPRASDSSSSQNPAAGTSYTIVQGDDLWQISLRALGDGTLWPEIYQANASELDRIARENGYTDSDMGRYVFAGTQIIIA